MMAENLREYFQHQWEAFPRFPQVSDEEQKRTAVTAAEGKLGGVESERE